ncbi:MAG TPA: HAMP domain-containing sensor histidine kinase [Candidatus Binataceae bacterium]|nr:HAMP domain-containing sensor histidine kinase [Candidatus Binataceae bacterium]
MQEAQLLPVTPVATGAILGSLVEPNELLANLCHELRAPLTVMTGYLEILIEDWGERLGAEPGQMLDRMRLSAAELAHTVENLIDWTNPAPPQPEQFNLDGLLSELAPALEAISRRRDLVLRFDVAPELRAVYCDRKMLRSILFNLCSNGLKFTDRGMVKVRIAPLSAGREGLALEIIDSGRGIDPESLALIFRPFVQLSHSNRRLSRGLGLGLALVKRQVAAMGGCVEVDSHPGAGSRFRVELPRVVPA